MRSAFKAGLFGTAVFALAVPALTQNAPKSLLPDLFEETPAPAPSAPDPRDRSPTPSPSSTPDAPGSAETPESALDQVGEEFGAADQPMDALAPPSAPDPMATRRATANIGNVGPLTPARGGYGARTFAGSEGRFMSILLNRLDAPVASRWAHIVLRRALLSRAPTPNGINAADWVAARALMLLKMGEVDGAKLLIDRLPIDRFTPRLYQVASQVHMAAGDVPALCPLAPTARTISEDDFWVLAQAVCAGFEGDEGTSSALFNSLRRSGNADDFNILLAEHVTSVASGIGRAANINWAEADSLTAYRFGMAAAGELEISDDLWNDAPVGVKGWAFRNGQVALERRAQVAPRAAVAGIVSAQELAAVSAAVSARSDQDEVPESARQMRAAYAGRTSSERISAMRELWADRETSTDTFGALIATAPAAALIEPSADSIEAAPDLIRSMLSAGRFNQALAWWPVLANAEEPLQFEGWALLLLADRGGVVPLNPGLMRSAYRVFAEEEGADAARRRIRSLLSSLAGLGRISGRGWGSLYEDFGVTAREDIHTEALERAARSGRRGEVAILSGIGLQTGWSGVRPQDVRPILSAWSRVGLGDEARMLAAEAYMRGA
ncbi:hypothetical protein ACSMXM_16620 [Pacificimonas sp. ICDLI1SI03]